MGIYQKGKNWFIDFRIKGRRKRKKVGPSKRLAEDALKEIQLKQAKHEFLGVYDAKKIALEAFAPKYLAYAKAHKTPQSYRRDEISLANLKSVFGQTYLYAIAPQAVEEYKAKRLDHGVMPATVNREIACLRHLFTKAVEWGVVRENPLRGVRMLKEPPGRTRYLSGEEIRRLLAAADSLPQDAHLYLRPILVVALNTGMRKGEILRIRWRNIDWTERTITIPKSKTNEVRTVPMNDAVVAALSALKADEGEYVFSADGSVPYGEVRKSFARAVAKAKIHEFRFHDLRHTFASHLVMQGCDLRTVQQLLGHKHIAMTMRYSHLSKAHLADAVAKLAAV